MARALRIEYPGALYHLTCRGNNRRAIFDDNSDRVAFLEILAQSRQIFGVRLMAYVLMENHFHLLVETPLGNLSKFMRRFNITYTGYFNRRHQRVGHVYQGRYQSFLIEKESYLSEVSRYIHLNPVRSQGSGENGRRIPLESFASLSLEQSSGISGSENQKAFCRLRFRIGGVRRGYAPREKGLPKKDNGGSIRGTGHPGKSYRPSCLGPGRFYRLGEENLSGERSRQGGPRLDRDEEIPESGRNSGNPMPRNGKHSRRVDIQKASAPSRGYGFIVPGRWADRSGDREDLRRGLQHRKPNQEKINPEAEP